MQVASGAKRNLFELTAKDVPGARFIVGQLEKHSVVQLRWWLVSRNEKIGNKVALIGEVCTLFVIIFVN